MKVQLITVLFLVTTFSSCKDDDTSEPDASNENNSIEFSAENFFSATIEGSSIKIEDDGINTIPTNVWNGSFSNDLSVIQYGNHVKFDNIAEDRITIYFAKSYADTSLILNSGTTVHSPYSRQNPFRNSANFHDIFKLNGQQPFFYSDKHSLNELPDSVYSGLVIEFKYNGKSYNSYPNFKTDSRNYYEVIKYESLKENATPTILNNYKLPYGKVKINFDCYLKEVNGTTIIHIERGSFQGEINNL